MVRRCAAHRTKKALRLTSADRFLVGAAWFDEKQSVTGGSDTSFTFQLTDQDSHQDGADGLAFVVQNEGPKVRGGLGASGGFMRSDNGAPGDFQRGILHRLAVCTAGAQPDLRWPLGASPTPRNCASASRTASCRPIWNGA